MFRFVIAMLAAFASFAPGTVSGCLDPPARPSPPVRPSSLVRPPPPAKSYAPGPGYRPYVARVLIVGPKGRRLASGTLVSPTEVLLPAGTVGGVEGAWSMTVELGARAQNGNAPFGTLGGEVIRVASSRVQGNLTIATLTRPSAVRPVRRLAGRWFCVGSRFTFHAWGQLPARVVRRHTYPFKVKNSTQTIVRMDLTGDGGTAFRTDGIACGGDWGGPLVQPSADGDVLVGVAVPGPPSDGFVNCGRATFVEF